MTFRFANIGGRSALLDDVNQWYDLERVTHGRIAADPMTALIDEAALQQANNDLVDAEPDGAFVDARVGPPIPRPRNSFAVGLNYRSHAAEAEMELPDQPLVFTKFPSCIVGPTDDIELRSDHADYEAELVVVIGRGGRDISADDAWGHVLGLTIGQDISDRRLQFAAKPPHFDLGKSRDTYGPIGPVLVSTDSFDDPTDLEIRCALNGNVVQNDRTSNLIFSVAQIIAYLSSILTLATGDLIFTGTPEGVGFGKKPPVTLRPGDEIVTTIHGIGRMTNRCVA